MMSRTREWAKFVVLVAVTIGLAFAFAAIVDLPKSTQAQEALAATVFPDTPPPSIPAAQPVADLGRAFVAVAEAVRPAVVTIESETPVNTTRRRSPFDDFFRSPEGQQEDRRRRGQGSGFIISEDGYIITNNHVVEEATRLQVRLLDRRTFQAEVVGRDPNTDIAVVKIDANDLTPLSLGDSDSLQIGEWVLAIGSPLGTDFSFTVTAGIVSGVGRPLRGIQQDLNFRIQDFIQTDAAINPGNSGGPLVNIRGQVVGVNSAIASPTGFYSGYGFAIPINLTRMVSQQLIATGTVTRAVLGVSIIDATAEDAEYVRLDSIYGVVIQSFSEDNSPAERAGLQVGDVIVELNGETVDRTAQLQQDIGFRRPGEQVQVTVARRGGLRETITVTLGQASPEEMQVASRLPRPEENREDDPGVPSTLGVTLRELTAARLAREGLDSELAGLQVTSVNQDGPARDRLLAREIITHVNDERVYTYEQLEQVLAQLPTDEEVVSLQVHRIQDQNNVASRVVRLRIAR
jgi:serine protease Do